MYFHVYIILSYNNALVLCQSEFACLHKAANTVVVFVKSNENTYQKGRALMQMYRVVPQTKGGNNNNNSSSNNNDFERNNTKMYTKYIQTNQTNRQYVSSNKTTIWTEKGGLNSETVLLARPNPTTMYIQIGFSNFTSVDPARN